MEVSVLVHAIMQSVDYISGNTYYALAGITNGSALIETTPYTVSEAVYVWKSLGAAIKELAEIVGYDWIIHPFSGFKLLMFFDPNAKSVDATITDVDLEGPPEITDIGDIVNRAIVIGGFKQTTDKSGSTQTGTTTITTIVAKTQSFVPTKNYISSVLIYTELVTGSESDLTMSLQGDSGSAPNGEIISNGQQTVKSAAIANGEYTEFRLPAHATLTPGNTYWIVLNGTSSDGVKVGVAGAVLDYHTRHPTRVAVMANNLESQERYKNSNGSPGIYTADYKDAVLEDPQLAETKANALLSPFPKRAASITVRGATLSAGDIVQLKLSETGIDIDAKMKIVASSKTVGTIFIYNSLQMEEM